MTKEESKQTLAAENLAVDKEMERLMKSVKKGFYPSGKPLSKILERKWNEEMKKVYAGSPDILEIVLNPVIILIPDSPKDNLMVTFIFQNDTPPQNYTQALQDETTRVFEQYFNGRFKVFSATMTSEPKKK